MLLLPERRLLDDGVSAGSVLEDDDGGGETDTEGVSSRRNATDLPVSEEVPGDAPSTDGRGVSALWLDGPASVADPDAWKMR